jgi:hypothetical protein
LAKSAANSGGGSDLRGYRGEFIDLVGQAKRLKRNS